MLVDKDFLRRELDAFARLFEICFDRRADTAALAWRYLDTPDGDALYVNLAIEDGEMVANYSASPFTLRTPRGAAPALLSMTTMTHPRCKGRGLFPTLAEELYAAAADAGCAIVMGFPNPVSHLPFVEKLGWSDVYEIPTFTLVVDPAVAVAGDAAVRDDAFALALEEPAWLSGLFRGDRRRERLQWRFADNPAHRYQRWCLVEHGRAHSHVVTKRFGEQLDVVDFVPRDADAAASLLGAVLAFAAANGATQLNAWLPPHAPHRRRLERLGFRPGGPVTYFGLRRLHGVAADADAGDAALRDHRNWFIQMSDSDVY